MAIRTVPTEVDLWDRFTLTHGDLALGIGLSTSKTTALIRALKLQDDPSCFRTRTRGKTRIYGYSAQALGRLRAALDEGLDPQEVWKRYWADVRESQRLRRSMMSEPGASQVVAAVAGPVVSRARRDRSGQV